MKHHSKKGSSKHTKKAKRSAKTRKSSNPWILHMKKCHREHPEWFSKENFKTAAAECRKTYKAK